MKLAIFALTTLAATAGAFAAPRSTAWVQPLDARPEALMIGASLLIVASLIRYAVAQNNSKH